MQITVHPFDKGYMLGMMYIGVYAVSDCQYDLRAKWLGEKAKGQDLGNSYDYAGHSIVPSISPFPAAEKACSQISGSSASETLQNREDSFANDDRWQRNGELSGANPKPCFRTHEQIRGMCCDEVCAWLTELDIDSKVIETARVLCLVGMDLAVMTTQALRKELGMSNLQAKRLQLNRRE